MGAGRKETADPAVCAFPGWRRKVEGCSLVKVKLSVSVLNHSQLSLSLFGCGMVTFDAHSKFRCSKVREGEA